MKQLIILLAGLLIISTSVSAQGVYFGNDNSGYGVFVGYSNNDNVDGIGVGFGQSFNGIIDLSYQFTNAKSKRYETQAIHTLGMALHPLNIQKIPLKISVDMSLSFQKYYKVYSIVPIFQFDLRLEKTAFLKFYGGVGYASISNSSNLRNEMIQYGISVFINNENKKVFVIDIGLVNYKEEKTIGVNLALFFGYSNNSPLPKYDSTWDNKKK